MPTCPACSGTSSRKSRRQLPRDAKRSRFVATYRCDDCGTRFNANDPLAIVSTVALGIAGTIVLAALGVLLEGDSKPPAVTTDRENPPADTVSSALGTRIEYVRPSDLDTLRAQAATGDRDSRYQLAMALLDLHDTSGSAALHVEAVGLLRQAAAQHHPAAQTELGHRYVSGNGVVQDFAQAADWYRRAAALGSPEAMYGLGRMAIEGWEDRLSLEEAYAWLNVAAARGEKPAAQLRDSLLGTLSADQLKAAQERSRVLDRTIPVLHEDLGRPNITASSTDSTVP